MTRSIFASVAVAVFALTGCGSAAIEEPASSEPEPQQQRLSTEVVKFPDGTSANCVTSPAGGLHCLRIN